MLWLPRWDGNSSLLYLCIPKLSHWIISHLLPSSCQPFCFLAKNPSSWIFSFWSYTGKTNENLILVNDILKKNLEFFGAFPPRQVPETYMQMGPSPYLKPAPLPGLLVWGHANFYCILKVDSWWSSFLHPSATTPSKLLSSHLIALVASFLSASPSLRFTLFWTFIHYWVVPKCSWLPGSHPSTSSKINPVRH